jgi:hypothetical protein
MASSTKDPSRLGDYSLRDGEANSIREVEPKTLLWIAVDMWTEDRNDDLRQASLDGIVVEP